MPNSSLIAEFSSAARKGVSRVSRDAAGALTGWLENGFELAVIRNVSANVVSLRLSSGQRVETEYFYFDALGNCTGTEGEHIPSAFADEVMSAGARGNSVARLSPDGIGLVDPATGATITFAPGQSVVRPTELSTYFSTYANFDIWRDSQGVVRHNFDRRTWCPTPDVTPWTNPNVFYVDVNAANDTGDGLTWATAKKVIASATTLGNAGAKGFIVYIRAGLYVRANSFGTVQPTQSCSYIAVGGRVVTGVIETLTSWALNSGTTYSVARANAARVYDIATKTEFGDYTEINKLTTLLACQSTPNSWYTDGTTLYVNRADGAAPTDANTRCYLTTVIGMRSTTLGNMYVSGIDFEGGNQFAFIAQQNATGRMVAESCSFKYVTDAGGTGFQMQNFGAAALVNCVAAHNPTDGFNAHQVSGTYPFMLTIGCVGRSNGKSGNQSCNGLTTHDGNAAMDISGVYHNNYGGNVAIVNPLTQLWCVGTRAYASYGDISFGGVNPSSDFLTDQNTPTLWLDGCVSGGSLYGIYKPSGTVKVRGGYIQQGLNGAVTY